MRSTASILLQHDSQRREPILDEISRVHGEIAGSEDEYEDRDQQADRNYLPQQCPNPFEVPLRLLQGKFKCSLRYHLHDRNRDNCF
jgi:hypothetical protein